MMSEKMQYRPAMKTVTTPATSVRHDDLRISTLGVEIHKKYIHVRCSLYKAVTSNCHMVITASYMGGRGTHLPNHFKEY